MAQEFKKGKTLVDGHGNFGSIEETALRPCDIQKPGWRS